MSWRDSSLSACCLPARIHFRFLAVLLALGISLAGRPLLGQANTGELQLKVTDPSGLGVQAAVTVSSEVNQVQTATVTQPDGTALVPRLPFGIYQVKVSRQGFATASVNVTIRNAVPTPLAVRLTLASSSSTVTVTAAPPLINPEQPGTVSRIGTSTLKDRLASLPGRSLQDLINSQPGWLFEGNAVLHPRGSEYQTQFVIDGVPVQDNRSPGSGPALEANDVSSMSVYTSGIPAQYGRKAGGVIVVNTLDATQPGFHGKAVISGGSYATRSGFFDGEYTAGKNTIGFSADGSGTSHYLNGVVPQNYTNNGTTGDFSVNYQARLTSRDRLDASLRHELDRYEIPNEQVQQQAGQVQNANNFETMGIVSYEHILSPRAIIAVHGMIRKNQNGFYSNPDSTPVELFQQNYFNEGYVNSSLTFDTASQELKFGVESDNTFLHENTSYHITDPSQYDPGTPPDFAFAGHKPDLEQAAYAEDLIHLGPWTVDAGLRWDHYQLLLNRNHFSPRLSISRYFPALAMTAHFSYDHVFQTPTSANLLLSSSSAVQSINPSNFYRLPVQPSIGNYFEVGFSKGLFSQLRLTGDFYRRYESNFADDDQIDNTGVSFPIALDRASIYGSDDQLSLPNWGPFSGYISYSYMVATASLPVTGGLFLGDNATAAVSQLSGNFWVSQDQRNTVRTRLRYQVTPRVWVAGGVDFDSGLPFDFNGDPATALAQYGPAVIARVNFARGRIRPTTLFNASLGATLVKGERYTVTLQADGENLGNLADVIDFGGLFSGNAIGPARSGYLRLEADF